MEVAGSQNREEHRLAVFKDETGWRDYTPSYGYTDEGSYGLKPKEATRNPDGTYKLQDLLTGEQVDDNIPYNKLHFLRLDDKTTQGKLGAKFIPNLYIHIPGANGIRAEDENGDTVSGVNLLGEFQGQNKQGRQISPEQYHRAWKELQTIGNVSDWRKWRDRKGHKYDSSIPQDQRTETPQQAKVGKRESADMERFGREGRDMEYLGLYPEIPDWNRKTREYKGYVDKPTFSKQGRLDYNTYMDLRVKQVEEAKELGVDTYDKKYKKGFRPYGYRTVEVLIRKEKEKRNLKENPPPPPPVFVGKGVGYTYLGNEYLDMTFEGVEYLIWRGNIYDDNYERYGKWMGDYIKFSSDEVAKEHLKMRDEEDIGKVSYPPETLPELVPFPATAKLPPPPRHGGKTQAEKDAEAEAYAKVEEEKIRILKMNLLRIRGNLAIYQDIIIWTRFSKREHI